jgi:hypothetical protein
MCSIYKKTYISPVSDALELRMKASLLTGSDTKGSRTPYDDGGEYTWS